MQDMPKVAYSLLLSIVHVHLRSCVAWEAIMCSNKSLIHSVRYIGTVPLFIRGETSFALYKL